MAFVYHSIVEKLARSNFERVNAHDVEGLLATCDANIVHRFGGEHALGGTRHGKEHLKLWFERLGRLAPNLKLTVTDVWVKGWPWDTTVIIRWTATETQPLPDDSTYANHGVHIVKLRYGKALSIDANEDSLAVHRMLELRAKHGSEEALAAPIEN